MAEPMKDGAPNVAQRQVQDATAQDVIDALRLLLVAQEGEGIHPALLKALVDLAPETDGARGIRLLIDLIREGTLVVEMVAHE